MAERTAHAAWQGNLKDGDESVALGSGSFSITRIDLDTQATVPDVEEAAVLKQAEIAKRTCPVSKALAATDLHLTARLTAPQAQGAAG
jgi:organic hydroperoxide reductase OsmC/OhrA